MARDSAVSAGMFDRRRHAFCTDISSTNDHRYSESGPTSARIASTVRALAIVASIFARFRTMPGSRINRSIFPPSNRATLAGSNPASACRYPSRLFRMVCHDSPACAPSSVSISNRWRSSRLGVPHSWSWYASMRASLPSAHPHRFLAMSLLSGERQWSARSRLVGLQRVQPVIANQDVTGDPQVAAPAGREGGVLPAYRGESSNRGRDVLLSEMLVALALHDRLAGHRSASA